MRSGFATIVGRPNVGKSSLLNNLLGTKVSIVSDKPQTTRTQVRGVLNQSDSQVVFLDTPGIHKPKTLLGERLNDTAKASLSSVDATVFVFDCAAGLGGGDEFIADKLPNDTICVLNKIDMVKPQRLLQQLAQAGRWNFSEYVPVSAKTGEGVDKMVELIIDRLPDGPLFYPDDVVTDVPEAFWVAELVREQLLAVVRDELPHSIACRVTEWEWPKVRCEILVERDSQKGIVIGKDGAVMKEVGSRARAQLPEGAFLELFVKVDKDWQRRPQALQKLGY